MLALIVALSAAPVPNGALIGEDRACYSINMIRAGQVRPIGATLQTIERRREGGRDVLRVVVHQRVNAGAFDMRDEFLLSADDLRPIRLESARQGKTHVLLRYDGRRIVGEKVAKDGAVQPVAVDLERPVWEGNLFGVTFAALPLANGARFELPFYQYDKGLGAFTLAVKGVRTVQTPAGPREAWVVEAGAAPGPWLEYEIDRKTRRELGYRSAQGSQTLGGDCSAMAGAG